MLTPLLNKIFSSLGEETNGTDDEIQLADLRKGYLNFLLVVLNNDLGLVLVSDGRAFTYPTIILYKANTINSQPADIRAAHRDCPTFRCGDKRPANLKACIFGHG